ncbi:MAG: SCO family protein [Thermodesulfovibrionales bacterium]
MRRMRLINLVIILMLVPSLLLWSRDSHGADKKKYERTVASYQVPDLMLTNQNGQRVRLREILISEKPVFLQFIYATCTTICPILSAGYANLQNRMGQDLKNIRLVSITIDPDHDTPEVMKEYLKRYNAKPGWEFLTGSRDEIKAVMKAFYTDVPNKMSHYPLTLLRSPDDGYWIRLFGFMSTQELKEEYHKVWEK